MKCPKCIEAGLRSTVQTSGSIATCMASHPFYDEDGDYHNHDPNTHTSSFHCSNGHHFYRRWQPKCPAQNCDWNKGAREEIIESR